MPLDPRTSTDILLVSQRPLWPLDQGQAIRGFNMALALERAGVRVTVATMEADESVPVDLRPLVVPWPDAAPEDVADFNRGWSGPLAPLRRKLASHQGLDPQRMAGVVTLAKRLRPQAVIALGQHGPLFLRGLRNLDWLTRVWYAADELVYFNLSCLRREPVPKWGARLYELTVHASLELLFAYGLDGAIGVSPLDTRLLQLIAGARNAETIRNGVDLNYFAPRRYERDAHSLAFWGRLDFEPNIDAVTWFARDVWPALRAKHPGAVWRIIGKNPVDAVRAICDARSGAAATGIELYADAPDLRPIVQRSTLAILPMRCGGGIKNKLLEAAAMGCTIVASPRAVRGVDLTTSDATTQAPTSPATLCRSASQWIESIEQLWNDPATASRLGGEARRWVEVRHNWDSAARRLVAWLTTLPRRAEHVPEERSHRVDRVDRNGKLGNGSSQERRNVLTRPASLNAKERAAKRRAA